ncbi:phage protein Gp36 family protein [Pseudoalteromonas sp. T1lg10]|uniref:phage protein Gp36 family protein n=1 Tax=Pseudoalteromonas sp. T1lg10 TaxID=2077093 RepID=UPI000CF630AF|nr:DUF1320 family protein [Pseudoalteromonas sp. T1lg10]
MFVTTQYVIDKIGVNVLLQFASGKFAEAGSYPTSDDVTTALLGVPATELQQQILAWYQSAEKNVTAIVSGFLPNADISQEQIDNSVLPGIACDLLYFELAVNPGDDNIKARKTSAMALLEKVSKGLIQIKEDAPAAARTGMRTKAAGTSFNWGGY